MKKSKKIFVASLIMMLTFLMFTACGKDEKGGDMDTSVYSVAYSVPEGFKDTTSSKSYERKNNDEFISFSVSRNSISSSYPAKECVADHEEYIKNSTDGKYKKEDVEVGGREGYVFKYDYGSQTKYEDYLVEGDDAVYKFRFNFSKYEGNTDEVKDILKSVKIAELE